MLQSRPTEVFFDGQKVHIFRRCFPGCNKISQIFLQKVKKYNKWPKPRSVLKIMIAFRGQTLSCFRSYARCIKSKSPWTTIIGISPYISCPLRAPVLCSEVETPYTIVYCIQHNNNSANCCNASGLITYDRFVCYGALLFTSESVCYETKNR